MSANATAYPALGVTKERFAGGTSRITARMMAAGKAALKRHSYDTGGTYEVACTAETLVRDIFKAMQAAQFAGLDDKIQREKARG